MRAKMAVLAFIAATACVLGYTRTKQSPPPDLRDAVADAPGTREFDTAIPSIKKDSGNLPVPKAVAAEEQPGGSAGGASVAIATAEPVDWVTIPGGEFMMGTDSGDRASAPAHKVSVKTFEMSKTLVTVEQYAECVEKGTCTLPGTRDFCNWKKKDSRPRHPVNCVDWYQANQYAEFMGARLPSEAEWEYAATSCGKAVISGYGCDGGSTEPVCSEAKGGTAQGLCNMAGNVYQWVQDTFRFSYEDTPTDGSALEGAGPLRVARGGAYGLAGSCKVRVYGRARSRPEESGDPLGFRIARSR